MNGARFFGAFTLTAMLSLYCGCAAVLVGGAAGVGVYTYQKGELKVSEKISLNKGWEATKEAVEDLDLTITDEKKDGLTGKLTARGADDRKIQIELEQKPNNITEFRIRIDTFGDEKQSRVIMDEIRKRF